MAHLPAMSNSRAMQWTAFRLRTPLQLPRLCTYHLYYPGSHLAILLRRMLYSRHKSPCKPHGSVV
jgi:hypothetical protein